MYSIFQLPEIVQFARDKFQQRAFFAGSEYLQEFDK